MSAPVITQQPQPVTATAGSNATFTAAATGAVSAELYRAAGSGGVSYGSTACDSNGNVSNTIAVSNSEAGNYFFAFRNAAWSSTHSAADTTLTDSAPLTVTGSGTGGPTTGTNPPTITGQPADADGNVGSQQTFHVYATTMAGTLTYQWYFNGAAISGATASSYTISPVADANAGNYYVVVGNGTGTRQSATVALVVEDGGTPGGGGGGIGGGGASLPGNLSPILSSYVTGSPDGLKPFASNTAIANRLILQDGTQGTKDEFNMDQVSVPYKVFAGANWEAFLPSRGTALPGFPNLWVWDPKSTFTVGKVWVEIRALARGLMRLNGVGESWNTFADNPPPRDTAGIGSAQISGTDGESVMDVIFRRPQTVYRYVSTSRNTVPPDDVHDPDAPGRSLRLESYSIRGKDTTADTNSDGNINGFNLGTRVRCDDIQTVQVGPFYQHEATLVREYYDTAGAS